MREFLIPKKIIAASGVKNAKSLLIKKDKQIGLDETSVAEFEAGSYIILDFGKEICGGVRLLTYMSDKLPVRIRLGESVSECCAELYGEKNATNDHSLRDITVTLPKYSDMTFCQSGFRFVRLDFEGAASLKNVWADSVILRKRAIGAYTGEDKLIKKIFDTAKRTVDLCASSDYLWDGIKRDRLVWVGDVHPEMLALTALYGRLYVIERSLEFVKDQTPLPAFMNRFPMYSMWWLIIVSDYYKYTGARDFAEAQLDYAEGLIDLFLANVDENGEMHYPSYFVDWATRHKSDETEGARAINIMAAKAAIELLGAFGRDTAKAKELLDRLMKKEICVHEMKQVAALKFFATELDDADKALLTEGGAKGMSTFMSYYILKAVASFDKAAAIDMMKTYYGAMLDMGATTFFEDFDMAWVENSAPITRLPKKNERDIHGDLGAYCYRGFRHSLCHGWSAGVLRFITEECN